MTASSEVQLADGRRVSLRPAGADDIDSIARLYQDLSPESFWRRFQFRASRPGPALVARLASLSADSPGSTRVVAVPQAGPDGVVAEARYVVLDDETAEMALAVRDDYQGTGLGGLLLDALVQRARADGLQRLRADVLHGNDPMLRLLYRYGCAAVSLADASGACLEISATGGMPGWPAGTVGRRVLVERHGWSDDQRVAALRSAGHEVRQCPGPLRKSGARCALVTCGDCRLAAEADLIVCQFPGGDPDCAAVLAAHRDRWPHLLAR
jgi:RimJ/RimL family protein N-acetyltransferase